MIGQPDGGHLEVTNLDAAAVEDEEEAMDQSERSRRLGGGRRPTLENPASGRRQSRSSRGLDRTKGDEIDEAEDEDDENAEASDANSTGQELGRGSVRGRRTVDDAASRRRSSSSTRAGRYGYGAEERLTLSAVPSAPKKSVGLAALLYCKPLDLANDDDKEDDDGKSATGHETREASPVSVADVEGGDGGRDRGGPRQRSHHNLVLRWW